MALTPLRFLAEPRWRVTGFLSVAAALNYADRLAISAVFPALREELHLSDVTLGLVGSLFLWSYALASPVAGLLADRFSRSRLVILSLVLWSGITALTGVTNGLIMLCVLRIALGLSESMYLPSAVALLADHHGPATRARAISTHSIGLNMGVVLGGTFAGFLAEHYGWRTGFWILGGGGIALACLAPFFISDGPKVKRLRREAGDQPPALQAARFLIRSRSFQILLGAEMLTGVTIWIFLNWLPLYFREAFDMSLAAAGFAGVIMLQGAMVLGMLVGGWISDKLAVGDARRRMLLLALSYLIAGPILLMFLAQPGFVLVVVTISAFSFVRGMGEASEKAALCEVVPVQFRATALGFMNTFATAAGGVGVFLAGLFKQELGLNMIFSASSGLLFVSGLSLYISYRVFMPRDMERARAFEADQKGIS